MIQKTYRKLMLATAVAAVLTACANDPTLPAVAAEEMGTGQFMISCADSADSCSRQANLSCPTGFRLVNALQNPDDRGLTMTIRCNG